MHRETTRTVPDENDAGRLRHLACGAHRERVTIVTVCHDICAVLMPINRRTLAAVALPLLMSGCVFYPTLTAYDDPECHLHRHKVGIEMTTLNIPASGDPEGDLVLLLFTGPVTGLVSGAVFVAGNSALQLENTAEVFVRKKTGHCAETPSGTPEQKPAPTTLAATPTS